MKPLPYIAGAALLALAAACGNSANNDAVPRRTAYPRAAVLDSVRTAWHAPACSLTVSRSATLSSERPGWLTATYPALGATLHLTVLQAHGQDANDEALANRRQRIALNLGGATARTDRYRSSGGYDVETVIATDGVATPVQFIANGGNTIISGAFILAGPTAPADSLRPIVKALEDEAFAIVNSIGSCKQ